MTPQDIVAEYFNRNYRVIIWPAVKDIKGPTIPGWTTNTYSASDYTASSRVGLMTGAEVSPNHYLIDVDIDWAAGALIAQSMLPATGMVFGRTSKKVSHCWYTVPEPIPSIRYEDIDGTCLIELRGTKSDGNLGMQTMVPPSVWTKETQSEPLTYLKFDLPYHIECAAIKNHTTYSAIGMILARHFGKNGFGHEPRLAWAGYLLRAGLSVDDLVKMGESLSVYTNNTEIADVRRVVESTAARMTDNKQKIKGGPTLARFLGDKGKEVIARINKWLDKDEDFRRDKSGRIREDDIYNIRRAIGLLNRDISFNEFSDKVLVDHVTPLDDPAMNDLWFQVDIEHHFRPTYAFFEKALKHLAREKIFHPVKDYLLSLQWDGIPRLNTWLIRTGGAKDTPYIQAVSKIMLCAAVKRIFHPGCKYDELVVLEGEQGLNKSSALRALCPRGEWFSDDLPLNVNSQKMIESTLGKWIIEAADLAGKRKAEVEQLKATLSRQVDGPARMAYAHLPVERARQFIIVGTTNSAAYLTDPTGARRFWPIAITRFDVDMIVQLRDQLWAEAMACQAESIRLPESLWPHAALEQEERREIDPWEASIRSALANSAPHLDGKVRIISDAIWEAIGIEPARRDRMGSMRIGEIMAKLGYIRTRIRPKGGEVEVGFVQDKTIAELIPEHDEGDSTLLSEIVLPDDVVPF